MYLLISYEKFLTKINIECKSFEKPLIQFIFQF